MISRYTFYKNKYGGELLIDVAELKYVKKFLSQSSVHTLTYYDTMFVTEGEDRFSMDNQTNEVASRDVFFPKPREIRNWDIHHIVNGYALIFEDELLSSLFKGSFFMQHLSFFQSGKTSSKLQLPDELCMRILQILHNVKTEIDSYRQDSVYISRTLPYEVLVLLDREYKKVNMEEKTTSEGVGSIHIDKFMKLVGSHLKEQRSVQYYADKLCITLNYLNEIVTPTKGISTKQYIRNKIVGGAKRLPTYTDLPISDIVLELHFSTISYFARNSRQYTGTTPLLYRRTHKP